MIEAPTSLKNRDALSAQLVRELAHLAKKSPQLRLEDVQCRLIISGGIWFEFGLPEALKVAQEGLYWDERGNWGDADSLYLLTE